MNYINTHNKSALKVKQTLIFFTLFHYNSIGNGTLLWPAHSISLCCSPGVELSLPDVQLTPGHSAEPSPSPEAPGPSTSSAPRSHRAHRSGGTRDDRYRSGKAKHTDTQYFRTKYTSQCTLPVLWKNTHTGTRTRINISFFFFFQTSTQNWCRQRWPSTKKRKWGCPCLPRDALPLSSLLWKTAHLQVHLIGFLNVLYV